MPESAPHTVIIAVTVDERVKEDADAALAPLGLTTSELLRRAVERIARQDRDLPALLAEVLDRDADLWRQILERLSLGADTPERERLIEQMRIASRRASFVVVADNDSQAAKTGDQPLVPNTETIAAIEAADRGEFVGEFRTDGEFLAWLEGL
jgi:antitoxin component of RelBE/YafQ-DinJ toxin-antitoxin module